MTRSLFGSVGALLLGLRSVSADYTCTLVSSPPAEAYCGVLGYINNFSYFLATATTGDPVSSPMECALYCSGQEGCGGFFFGNDDAPICQTFSGTASDVYEADPSSPYTVYDISCFGCSASSASLSSISSSASSLPTTAAPKPTGPLICYQDNCFRAFLRFSSEGSDFCATYTTTVNTQPTDIPSFLDNCFGSPSAASSGCDCLASFTSTTSSFPTSAPAPTTSDGPSATPSTGPLSTGQSSSDVSSPVPYPSTNSTLSLMPSTTPSVGPLTAKPSNPTTSSSVPYSTTNSTLSSAPPPNSSVSSTTSTVGPLTAGLSSNVSGGASFSVNSTPAPYPFTNSTTLYSATPSSSSIPSTSTVGPLTTRASSSASSGASSSISSNPGSSSASYPMGNSTSSATGIGSLPFSSIKDSTTSQTALVSSGISSPISSGSGFQAPTTTASVSSQADPGAESTISTVFATTTYTITSCAPTVTDCPVGHVTTETIALYTIICPVTEPSSSYPSIPAGYTTSTIYSTQVETITKCPPTITNCPVGSVTTKTVAVSTTICPISETPAPEIKEEYTLSTVYATTAYTITSCAPTVTNCPVGKIMTETVSLYTTYCPVSGAEEASLTATPPAKQTVTVQVSFVSGVAAGKPEGMSFQPPVASSKAQAGITTVEVVPVPVASSKPAEASGSGAGAGAISAGVATSKVGTLASAATSRPALVTANGAEIVGIRWMGMVLSLVLACAMLL